MKDPRISPDFLEDYPKLQWIRDAKHSPSALMFPRLHSGSAAMALRWFGKVLTIEGVGIEDYTWHRSKQAEQPHSLEVKTGGNHSVVYPLDSDKNITVEVDGEKMKITTSKYELSGTHLAAPLTHALLAS